MGKARKNDTVPSGQLVTKKQSLHNFFLRNVFSKCLCTHVLCIRYITIKIISKL